MRQKGLAQLLLVAACVFAACIPCKVALAEGQVGIGAIDVTVEQVAPKDESAEDEPKDKGSDNNETDSPKSVTPQALEDAREVVSGNAWIVASTSDNKTDNAAAEANLDQEPALLLAETGDSSPLSIAAVVGCVGAGTAASALVIRARVNKGKGGDIRGDSDE